MSVYKGLNRSDVYLTDYTSRKKWTVTGSHLEELGLRLMMAKSSSRPYYPVEEDERTYSVASGSTFYSSSTTCSTYNSKLLYGRIYEQYYNGSLKDGTFTGSTDLSLQTTLTITGSRAINDEFYRDPEHETWIPDSEKQDPIGIVVVSIPAGVMGTSLEPGKFEVKLDKDVYMYVEDDYMMSETGSFCDEGYPLGTWTRESDHWVDPYFEDLHAAHVFDFEGVLLADGFAGEWHQPEEYDYPTPKQFVQKVVGDIIYTHGILVFTDPYYRYLLGNWPVDSFNWESNKPIFTEHVICKVRDIDFNKTLNKTAPEELQNTPGFTPYVTAVGLYNNVGDLIAVAKLSKPIKKPLDTEMTFDLQIDLG